MLSLFCTLLVVLSVQQQCSAQSAFNNIRFKSIALTGDTLKLDSLSMVPNTLVVKAPDGTVIDSSSYTIKAFESKLIWKQKPTVDSIKAFFRVYPFALADETYHKSYARYMDGNANSLLRPFIYNPEEVGNKLIDFGSLDYNGSFARSVSFGNNQNVTLNSLFNLQLSGMLTKDLEITAAITDNNIPIQPEGNTQQIQEFDKVFIQLRQDQQKVIVGDFDLYNPEKNYFLKFSKKNLGGYYSGAYKIKKVGTISTNVAGGISRGKFARNSLVVTEGNQGPYKLTGANGETFIIILSNTEEVFINGAKMERGADRDYVIDYNLGEIRFMPRRIISKDLRIVVEFEYSDKNYQRSSVYANTELQTKVADVRFNLYSEQDSKGQNVQQNLNAEKKQFLANLGDSIQNAYFRGFDSVGYDANRVLYDLRDTLVFQSGFNFHFDSVLVYSTDTVRAKFAATFTYVGEGKGNYTPVNSTANGRVFSWVAPFIDTSTFTAVPQGSYEPVIFLVTPKYQQMYTLATDVRIDKNNTLSAEVAMSNFDNNMFSSKNNSTNLGFAARAGYTGKIITKRDTAGQSLQNFSYTFNYEFLQNRFNTIERYRNIEFNRDWNLAVSQKRYNEHLATANLGYNWSKAGSINYRFKAFVQDTFYRGYENGLNANISRNGVNFTLATSYLSSKSLTGSSNYIRPKADFYYTSAKTKGWKIGTLFDHEINMIKGKGSDTLTGASYLWQNYKVYAGTADTAVNKFGIEAGVRIEHKGKGQTFNTPYYQAQFVTISGQVSSIKNQTINYNFTYRHAVNKDSAVILNQPEHFYLGRVDYSFTAVRGVFRSTTLYEIGTGTQQKQQVIFVASPTNQGDYIYPENGDKNGNGVKDISEYVPKPSGFTYDSSYFRTFVTTPELVPVNSTQFNQVLNINPAAVWRNKTGVRKIVAMFSVFASISISKKTFVEKSKKVGDYFNPFPLKREDNQVVATTISSRNTLYFNRMESKYGAQFDFNYTRNRTLLTAGFENRLVQSQGVSLRWNIIKALNTQWGYVNGLKSNQSDFYDNLRYRFTYNDASADINYQFKTFLRIGLKYDFSNKINPTDTVGNQTAQSHKLTLNARYNRQGKSSVDASFSYATIKYNDKNYPNQQLEYAMLEGLNNGNNLVWSASYSQSLTENIQLTIVYDGRMTGFTPGDKSTLKSVHTGRAEIRAVF